MLLNKALTSSRLTREGIRPEVYELKVLQTGNGDGAFDAGSIFLARVLAVADSLGIRFPAGKDQRNGNNTE